MRKDTQTGARHTAYASRGHQDGLSRSTLPEHLEKHVQLQRARLDTYAKLREELSRLVCRGRGFTATKPGGVAKSKDTRPDDPMDVGGFVTPGKAKGKGKDGKDKGKGKEAPAKTDKACFRQERPLSEGLLEKATRRQTAAWQRWQRRWRREQRKGNRQDQRRRSFGRGARGRACG
eukprot:1633354-Amphidinium_carterae.1